jgi:hypothetical protein
MTMPTENKKDIPTKVVTKLVRLSYVKLWNPETDDTTGRDKYSASIIIPKSDKDVIARIKRAIEAAYKEGEGTLKGNGKTVPSLEKLKTPLRDGDEDRPDDEAYADSYFVNATTYNDPPQIFGIDGNPLTDRKLIYSGCYARASVNFYAYNVNGNKGIACGLNGIQRIKDGEPLGGRGNVRADFDDDFAEDYALSDDDDFLS